MSMLKRLKTSKARRYVTCSCLWSSMSGMLKDHPSWKVTSCYVCDNTDLIIYRKALFTLN